MAVPDTLKGFRTQFLYTLYRVIIDSEKQHIFVPEGREDLDVYEDGRIVETIQIKNLKNPIHYSDLSSPAKTTSFFQRGIDTLKQNSDARLTLASFGPIGKDLLEPRTVLRNIKSKPELKKYANDLIDSFKIDKIDEEEIGSKINAILKKDFPAFNPKKEISYLLEWIYEKAERGQRFTREDLVRHLYSFIEFESSQKAYGTQIGLSIKSIFNEQDLSSLDQVALRNEFSEGVSTRPEHILLDCDRIRPAILDSITSGFQRNNIVVLHGISGQGKSTVCYRYLKDYHSLSFEVSNIGSNNIASIIASISQIIEGLEIPALLYFDVTPGSNDWVKIIKEFSQYRNVKFLISIREEDWINSQPLLNGYTSYNEISLKLSRAEAQGIFNDNLIQKTTRLFDEIWETLGEDVPLLEFMYYVTHGMKLRDKIKSQYLTLSRETKKILYRITIARSLDAYIDKSALMQALSIDSIDLEENLNKIIGEYFYLTQNNLFVDIHPVRTEILRNIMCGEDKQSFIRDSLSFLKDADIKNTTTYIKRLVGFGMTKDELLSFIQSTDSVKPGLFCGACRAMIWIGAREYGEKNKTVANRLKEFVGNGWTIFIPVNYSGSDVMTVFYDLPDANKEYLREIELLRNEFTDQSDIFKPLKDWLSVNPHSLMMRKPKDLLEVCRLINMLHLEGLENLITIIGNFPAFYDSFSASELAEILQALKLSNQFNEYWPAIEKIFIRKIRLERKLYYLQITETEVRALTSIGLIKGFDKYIVNSQNTNISTYINDNIVEICQLFRKAFPEKFKFNIEIKNGLFTPLLINTEKHIDKNNLPLPECILVRNYVCEFYNEFERYNSGSSLIGNIVEMFALYDKACQKTSFLFNHFWSSRKITNSLFQDMISCIEQATSFVMMDVPSKIAELEDSVLKPILQTPAENKYYNLKGLHNEATQLKTRLDNYFIQMQQAITSSFENGIVRLSKSNLLDAVLCQQNLCDSIMRFADEESRTALIANLRQYKNRLIKLWLQWEYICRIPQKPINDKILTDRYNNIKNSLIGKLIGYIKSEFDSMGYAVSTTLLDGNLKIRAEYSDYLLSAQLLPTLRNALLEFVNKYEFESTQRLIVCTELASISLHGMYKSSSGKLYNIEGNGITIKSDCIFLLNEDTYSLFQYTQDTYDLSHEGIKQIHSLNVLTNLLRVLSSQLSDLNYIVVANDAIGINLLHDLKAEYQGIDDNIKDAIEGVNIFITNMDSCICRELLEEIKNKFLGIIDLGWQEHLDELTELTNYLDTNLLFLKASIVDEL